MPHEPPGLTDSTATMRTCVVFAPSSNDESGTVSLDQVLLGPSPMGKSQVKWQGRTEFQGSIGYRIETVLDAGT